MTRALGLIAWVDASGRRPTVRARVVCACMLALACGAPPALAQVDLSGVWRSVRHEDLPDRGPGVGLGDYTGIPLTDAARQWAESWDAARLSVPEHQCQVHVAHYVFRGPLNLRIWEERDPRTQEVVALKNYISTYEQTRTIWMDGRPHPPWYAPHTWMGFSTGRWVGDQLVVETTHIKQGWHRRNGVPASDLTTMTEHFVRHADTFTHIAVIHDPVFLSEPMVKSQHFEIVVRELPPDNWLWPCTPVEEVARERHEVPHFLPGENPYIEPTREEFHLLVAGAEGGAETTYAGWSTDGPPRAAPPKGPVETVKGPWDAEDGDVHVWPVRDNVYMLVSRGSNATVQIGDEGVFLVDTMEAGLDAKLLAAIRTLGDGPIRYIVNTSATARHMGNNAPIAAAGSTRTGGVVVRQIGAGITSTAAIIAHENVLTRVSAPTGESAPLPFAAWPSETFFGERRDFTFNDDRIVIEHMPAAHTDGDTIVFFRRADVISAGDVFDPTGYPAIDTQRGGTIEGTIAALNRLIDIAVPDVDEEGGTMIVPGRGRLSDETDVVEYRDMVVIVRDRVRHLIDQGMSLREVQAARPTYDFDARYGAPSGPGTAAMFVNAVYAGLRSAR